MFNLFENIFIFRSIHHTILSGYVVNNRCFVHFRFDSKIRCLYTCFHKSYFPYVSLARALEIKGQKKYNFLIICRYLNLVILKQIENLQVVIITFKF
jgi:hypothetical protein